MLVKNLLRTVSLGSNSGIESASYRSHKRYHPQIVLLEAIYGYQWKDAEEVSRTISTKSICQYGNENIYKERMKF